MKKLLACIILLAGCASAQSSGTEVDKPKSADKVMDFEQRKLEKMEKNILAEIDLQEVPGWEKIGEKPIEVYQTKKILGLWSKRIYTLRLGRHILTKSADGKFGSFSLDRNGRMIMRCVSDDKSMKSGYCDILTADGNYKVGYANTLSARYDFRSMTISLTDLSNKIHQVRLE